MQTLTELLKVRRGDATEFANELESQGFVKKSDGAWQLTALGREKVAPELERAAVFSDPETEDQDHSLRRGKL